MNHKKKKRIFNSLGNNFKNNFQFKLLFKTRSEAPSNFDGIEIIYQMEFLKFDSNF